MLMAQIAEDPHLLGFSQVTLSVGIRERAHQPSRAVLRILVVDDICDNADALAMIVESGGHEARPAYSGTEALDAIAEFQPDVVILEIGTLDGYELGRQVRRHPLGRNTLLIAITAYGYDSDYRQSIGAGFDHHLRTPADPNVVHRLLSARRPKWPL